MGKTLLHYAAQGLNPKMIDLILRLTPPEVVNAKDCRGRTALHLSSSNYNYLTYRRMIPKSKFHIDENEFYQSKEKVLLEMNKKSERCCEILLQHGASAHLKDIHVRHIFVTFSLE
jgi:ankyrin repeat protein